jgi:hypothetical protein
MLNNAKLFILLPWGRSPMTDFLIDCYFNGFCKGIKNFISTPRYAKKLRAMRQSAEAALPTNSNGTQTVYSRKNPKSNL